MKLNKKGFMLAEVVIVASVIATVLVTVYILLNRVSNSYETRNRYNDIDAMYAAMEINDIIKEDTAINKDSWAELTSDNYNNFKTFYRNATNNGYTIKSWYVDNTQNIDSINTSNDVSLGNYISYLNDKLGEEDYDYLVIVELSKGIDDNYYYTLKVGGTNASE